MLVDLEPGDRGWQAALPVLRGLRPHMTGELLAQVLDEGRRQGLRFTAVLEHDRCVAVAGWRVVANASSIRKLYVDDLATAAADRSQGHGASLLAALTDRGRDLGCRSIELDSGVQRHDAHRFYLRERMAISAHHFSKPC